MEKNPKFGRPVNPESTRQRLMAEGVPKRRYYAVREELRDAGIDASFEDIVDICRVRQRKPVK